MKEIRQYLEQPSGHQLYSQGLHLAQKYASTEHAPLLSQLKAGPMGSNRQRLIDMLRKIAGTPVLQSTTVEVHASPEPVSEMTPQSSHEIDLLVQLRRARQHRAMCSQNLHTANSDAERAAVCDTIDRATTKVKNLEKKYAFLKKHGRLPVEQVSFDPLPTTLEDLRREGARLASQRLKVENRLLYLYTLPENSRKRKQIPDNEEKLRAINARFLAVRFEKKKLEYEPEENDA